ncbi:RNA polymerase sigma factor [Nocardia sp. NPDC052566]|uniref:RNA polymerase sigma factor n=1 Tax=Nocardia sp. NPDC052566 TaxID=3364330 RepID=UPI0037C710DE
MEDPEKFGARLRPLAQQVPSAAAADLAVYTDFYRSFTPTLVAFLIYHGAHVADAAEIVQDTMMKAWQSWPTIEHPAAWARRVASRALIRRIASIEDEETVAEMPERSALLTTHVDVAAWECHHDILRVLLQLPPRQRQIMAWTLDGYTPSEISAELRLSPALVRSNLRKARRNIAILLDSQSEEP